MANPGGVAYDVCSKPQQTFEHTLELMKLRVCQIIPTLVQGGAEKQMSLLARYLNSDEFESHVVVLTHSGVLEDELRVSGVNLHFIEKRGKLDVGAYRRLKRKLREIKPDVVHTWLFAANSYGRQAAKSVGVPVIIAGERCVDPWKQWWHHRIDRHLLKSTARMTTNTNAVVDFYQKQGIPSDRFTVIPNAVVKESGADRRLARDDFFERLKLEPRKHIIGAVGRLWKQKGYQDLIWAAELIRAVNEDAWFVIVGDGPEREQLQKFRDQIDGQHIVKFLGHRSDAAELMQCFDVLWNGSLYEGQSNTILEAMATGVPVLASDIPGNRDLIENERTGILYPLGDVETLSRQTLVLLQNESTRIELGDNAKHRIQEDFSLAKMVNRYSQLYRELYEKKKVAR